MMLLVDAGNTRIKWACFESAAVTAQSGVELPRLGAWVQSGAMSHTEFAATAHPWQGLPLERVLISNVAGTAVRDRLLAAFQSESPLVQWFAAQAQLGGITNHYRMPTQLGCDRFAAVIGAHALFPKKNLIVATCGTATTIDAVSAQGEFIGGMIAPGLKLMAESLHTNTANLPAVAASGALSALFADHTEAAIVSGCLSAQAGAIAHAVGMFVDVQPDAVLCVLSGGAARYIAPHLRVEHQYVDNLVLIGLQVVAQW